MSNVNIVLTRDQADALMTVLSGLEDGSDLRGLYEAMKTQMGSRPFKYRLELSNDEHKVYNIPLLRLTAKQ